MQSKITEKEKQSLIPLNAEITINASPADVWKIVGTEFDKIMKYSSDVKKSYYLNQRNDMVGSQRRSEMRNGSTLDVVITAWEPQQRIEWEIVKAHIPILKAGVSSYTLIPQGTKTRLVLNSGFKTVFFLLNPIAKRKFKTVVTGDLAGIKHLVETGEQVSTEKVAGILKRYKDQVAFP